MLRSIQIWQFRWFEACVELSCKKKCSERQCLTQCPPLENGKRHYCCSQIPIAARIKTTMSPSLVFSGRFVQRRLIPSRLHLLLLVHFVLISKQPANPQATQRQPFSDLYTKTPHPTTTNGRYTSSSCPKFVPASKQASSIRRHTPKSVRYGEQAHQLASKHSSRKAISSIQSADIAPESVTCGEQVNQRSRSQPKSPTPFSSQPLPSFHIPPNFLLRQSIAPSPICATSPASEPMMALPEHLFYPWARYRPKHRISIHSIFLRHEDLAKLGRLSPFGEIGGFGFRAGVGI